MGSNADSSGKARLHTAATVWNDSGGVGKTTITINTAEALAEKGKDVLVIDLDPQYGGLTDHAGYEAALQHPDYNIMDALLMPNRSLDDIIVRGTEENNLPWDLITAHSDLEQFETRMASNLPLDEHQLIQLRKAIGNSNIPYQYDCMLIDCQASRGGLVANSIAATNNVLIPTELSRKGVRSVDGLVDFVKTVERDLRQLDETSDSITTGIVSVVPNKAAKTGRLTKNEQNSMETLLRNHLSVMPPFYVPSRTLLSEAWTEQMTLREYLRQDTTRDLRDNEKQLIDIFDILAESVANGAIRNTEISEDIINVPSKIYNSATQDMNENANSKAVHRGFNNA
jgi:chromosome partitioning protein